MQEQNIQNKDARARSVAEAALGWAKTKLGCAYNQSKRMRTNPDIFDCSSLVYRAYKAAGYRMKHSTSTYEVQDPGFELIFPGSQKEIGKRFYTLEEIRRSGWFVLPGDLIFYNQKVTTRKNKITHVAMALDAQRILHARNPQKGVCVDPIRLYDGTICAVTRFCDLVKA